MSTNSQIDANRLNAQLSTGPTSVEGKETSRLNAVKHGIYSRIQFLPGEDRELFAAIAQDYQTRWDPQGADEILLVDGLIRNDWYLRRLDRIEAIVITNALDATLPPDEAFAKLFCDTGRNNPLTKLRKEQASLQRNWFKALAQLQRLQKMRRAAKQEETEEQEQAEQMEPTKTKPIAEVSASIEAPPTPPVPNANPIA